MSNSFLQGDFMNEMVFTLEYLEEEIKSAKAEQATNVEKTRKQVEEIQKQIRELQDKANELVNACNSQNFRLEGVIDFCEDLKRSFFKQEGVL